MSEDATAALVSKRWIKADQALIEDRRNYWMNYSYYTGHQWIWWDPIRSVVQNAVPSAYVDADRVRITINKIQERVNQLIGRAVGKNLAFEVQATSADDATLSGANLGEWLLEARRQDADWEGIREENLFNALMGGTSAIVVDWDGSEGDKLWIDSQNNQVVGTGEVSLSPLSIAEFSLTPGVRRWYDAPWWVGCTAVPPEVVRDHYNLGWTPQADASRSYSPLQREMLSQRGFETQAELTAVYVMYERPNNKNPKGRRCAVVNDKTIVDEPWPFTHDELNLQVFRQIKLPMKWTGTTVVTASRAPQTAYNQVRSAIIETAKLASNPRLLVPHGSLDEETALTDEPGEIINYWPDQGAPNYLEAPEVKRWLQQEADRLEAELDGILHTHAVSRGIAPGDRNSGLALSILAEKNDTPLGPMARDQANGWGRIGSLVLKLYGEKATEKRTALIMTEHGVPRKLEWDSRKLHDQTRVTVPLDATLPQSRMATQAMLTNLAGSFPAFAAMLNNDTIVKVLDLPGQKLISSIVDPDVGRALKENDLMSVGEVVIPLKFEDHAKHIAEHNRFRNTDEYRMADPEMKSAVDAHIVAHQRLVQEEAVAQARVNAINPGFGALPQADNPIGSAVPQDFKTATTPQGPPQ